MPICYRDGQDVRVGDTVKGTVPGVTDAAGLPVVFCGVVVGVGRTDGEFGVPYLEVARVTAHRVPKAEADTILKYHRHVTAHCVLGQGEAADGGDQDRVMASADLAVGHPDGFELVVRGVG